MLILYIFEKRLKNLKNSNLYSFFVNNELLITQNKSLTVSNSLLFCIYHIILPFLKQFGLIIEHGKTKVFYFSRSHENFKLPPLDLIQLGGSIIWPKNIWWYLGFIFNRKLTFQQHVDFYRNKAMLTIMCMKMLSNSSRGLIPIQKQLLYKSYILSVVFYSFQLWHYNKALLFISPQRA